MHGTALSRTKRRAGSHGSATRTGALKNWLTRYRAARYGPNRRSGSGLRRYGSFINRARAGLRHDHARRGGEWPLRDRHSRTNHGSARLPWSWRHSGTRRRRRDCRGGGGGDRRLHRNRRRSLRLRGRGWRRNYIDRTRAGVRQNHAWSGRWWHDRFRWRGRDCGDRRSRSGLHFDRDRWNGRPRSGRWGYRDRRLLFTNDGLQDISGL
jgi:hypothetical protein